MSFSTVDLLIWTLPALFFYVAGNSYQPFNWLLTLVWGGFGPLIIGLYRYKTIGKVSWKGGIYEGKEAVKTLKMLFYAPLVFLVFLISVYFVRK